MANGQLVASSYFYTDGLGRDFIWLQSSSRHFCAINGYRSYIWPHGRYYRQVHIQVRSVRV